METVLVWLAIGLGVCWLVLKILNDPRRHERDPEEREPHNPFRK